MHFTLAVFIWLAFCFVLFFLLLQVPSKSFTIIVVDNDFRSRKFFFVSSTLNVVVVIWAMSALSLLSLLFAFFIYLNSFCYPFETSMQCKLMNTLNIWCFDLAFHADAIRKVSNVRPTDSRLASRAQFTTQKSSYFISRLKSIKSIKLNKMIMISITNCDFELENSHSKYWMCCVVL